MRFDDRSGAGTRIKYVTDGLLLREALSDATLARYAVVVVDEAHERSLHTDVLLGLLRGLLARRRHDFRLVVTSATLDADLFVRFFEPVAQVRAARVRGRQHPVRLMYTVVPEEDYLDAALCCCLQVHAETPLPGDMLVFLTGTEEIDALARLLRDRAAALPPGAPRLLPAPLYAAQSGEAQAAAFALPPPGVRKVVLATNIAETSITIPGVRIVIDPGLSKQRSYSARTGAESLAIAPVSRGAARQRAGRAGREAPGTCYRLYTEASFGALDAESAPELTRCSLGGAVLQLKALGVTDVLQFPLLTPPPRGALLKALEQLYSLGALDDSGDLTPTGRTMARLPLDPLAAKALLAAAEAGVAPQAIAVLAMLSADGVYSHTGGGGEGEADARASRASFRDPTGDHGTLRNLLEAYGGAPAGGRAHFCREHGLSARAMARAADVAAQLGRVLGDAAVGAAAVGEAEAVDGDGTALRRALLAGYFMQAARRQPDGSYRTMAGSQVVVHIHPSSVLFGPAAGGGPPVVMFNELVRTSKLYVRDVSAITATWLPELAPRYFKPAGS